MKLITCLLLVLISMSCLDGQVQNGSVVYNSSSNGDNPGVYLTNIPNMKYGYAEADLTITDINTAQFQIFLRAQDGGNTYLCIIGNVDSNATMEIGALAVIGSSYSVHKFCTAPSAGNDDEGAMDFAPTTYFSTERTLGCEIVHDNGEDKLRAYVDGIQVAEYIIGQGTLETDCSTPNIDPVINTGKVGFGFRETSDADVAAQNIKVNAFRFFNKRPY